MISSGIKSGKTNLLLWYIHYSGCMRTVQAEILWYFDKGRYNSAEFLLNEEFQETYKVGPDVCMGLVLVREIRN